jgi:hypothetical protein
MASQTSQMESVILEEDIDENYEPTEDGPRASPASARLGRAQGACGRAPAGRRHHASHFQRAAAVGQRAARNCATGTAVTVAA